MVQIRRFKILEDSIRKSFSNVRLDIVNIKDYLEKQHDILNKEITDLQGQILALKKELTEKTRESSDYLRRDELAKNLETHREILRNIRDDTKVLDVRLADLERSIVKIENEKAESEELEKAALSFTKEARQIRAEFYAEFEILDKKLRDTKLKIIEEQSRELQQKLKKLDKSIEDVGELKATLRLIVKQEKSKKSADKGLRVLESKLRQKSFFTRLKEGVSDFLFEDESFLEEAEIEEEKKPRKGKEKDRINLLAFIIPLVIFFTIVGLGYLYWGDISRGFNTLISERNNTGVTIIGAPVNLSNTTVKPIINETQRFEGPVIQVYEGDYVDIIPNMSDADNDRLIYAFSRPLNATGKWQTKSGDAGVYPIRVIVSDGQNDTEMKFTLIVKPK